MNLDLSGKRALVCGSTKGIGKASAMVLANMGASITLLARNETALMDLLEQLPESAAATHHYLVADFSDLNQLQEALNNYQEPIHILVNNTGGPAAGPILNAEASAFLQAFNNHLLANHMLAQKVIPGMKEAGFGRIINIISTSVKQPLPGLGVSNTIRAAVANWSKTLAGEVAPFGITVNNVLPGATATERLSEIINNKSTKLGKSIEVVSEEMAHEIPMGRFAEAEEIANAVGFLASKAASYITGINLPVDGGRTGSL